MKFNRIFASLIALLPLASFGECVGHEHGHKRNHAKYHAGKSHAKHESNTDESTFYLKGFYNAGVGSSKFEGAGNGYVAANSTATTDGSITGEYKPEYDFNPIGGGLAVGYSFSGMRVELEGIISDKFESEDKVFYVDADIPTELATADNNLEGLTKAPAEFKNNGFSYMAGMLNAYYDFAISDVIMPYIGIGGGIADVKFKSNQDVDIYPLAVQFKVGANFNMREISGTKIMPYIGYRALYFTDTEVNDDNVLTSDTVIRDDGVDDEVLIVDPISGAEFPYKMKSNTLLHNIEAGFMVPLNN